MHDKVLRKIYVFLIRKLFPVNNNICFYPRVCVQDNNSVERICRRELIANFCNYIGSIEKKISLEVASCCETMHPILRIVKS